jgi:RNA polymerase sigma factor (sigma-70 family)
MNNVKPKWVSDLSEDEWQEIIRTANRIAKRANNHVSLGYEDYAASAIEKLLNERECPRSIEAWLRTVIRRQMIDRARKIEARGGSSLRDLPVEEIEREMLTRIQPSLGSIYANKEAVEELFSRLTPQEQKILAMYSLGFDNHTIADELNFASNKVVATRLGQIRRKLSSH